TDIVRPLLSYPKDEIRRYAIEHGVDWREDATNTDTAYLRNYIRHTIVAKLDKEKREALAALLENIKETNEKLDDEIANYLQFKEKKLIKADFITLPHAIATEVMASWLRSHGIREFDKKTI